MLCNAGESKSIFVDVQNPCLQPPLTEVRKYKKQYWEKKHIQPVTS